MKKTWIELGVIVSVLLGLTLLFSYIDADRALGRIVIMPNGKWPGVNTFPWAALYDYAAVPGFIMAGFGLFLWLLGFHRKDLGKYKRRGLFLVLLLILGPGLVVNVVFKDNLGRARPREIVEFGGKHQYTEIWQAGPTGKNSSFPSGHASVAFYLMAPWFLFRRENRKTAFLFLGAGLAYGGLIGVTRIIQGGHFLSDVMWAGGFVYLVGLLLSLVLLKGDGTGSALRSES